MSTRKKTQQQGAAGSEIDLQQRSPDSIPQTSTPGDSGKLHFGADRVLWGRFAVDFQYAADLLPVVSDPSAEKSPLSKMQATGKTPSYFNNDGQAIGFAGWTKYQATAREIKKWSEDNRLGICLQTRNARAIDVDVDDFDEATDIEDFIADFLALPIPTRRRSNSTKFLHLVHSPGELTKRRVAVKGGFIELLATGQQCIVGGTHTSGVRYKWDGGLPSAVPAVSLARLNELWAALVNRFGTGESSEAKSGRVLAVARRAEDGTGDPVVDYLKGNWTVHSIDGISGRVDIECPFAEGHSTDSGETSTSYFPAGTGGMERGHFKCLHASCNGRKDGDFLDEIGYTTADFDIIDLSPEEEAEQKAIRERNTRRADRMTQAAIEKAKFSSAETRLDRSDTANVNLMHRHTKGDLRYLSELDQWLTWTGTRWEVDQKKKNLQAASREVGEHYHREATEQRKAADAPGVPPEDRKRLSKVADSSEAWSTQCRNHRKLTDMQAQAKMDARFTVNLDQLDRAPYLLGVQNGVVDLRTATLHPDARDQFITRRAAFDFFPEAPAPRWCSFIEEITSTPIPVEYDPTGKVRPDTVGRYTPRPEYARYVQKALGYSLTGLTREQKMFICCGEGSNGKNIMLDTLKVLLPDYVAIIAAALLTASSKIGDAQAPTAATAALAGNRFAIASEAMEGARLDIAMVKAHTGNKYMTARFLHKNDTTFEVTHKLWLMTNHIPRIDALDKAILGRLHILPFDRRWNRPGEERDPTLPDGDKRLADSLQGEAAGILAWLIDGAALYFAEGLEPPTEVASSTRKYFKAQDAFNAWVDANCEPCEAGNNGEQAAVLFNDFAEWCRANGHKQRPDNQKAFSIRLKNEGYEAVKKGTTRYPLKFKRDSTDLSDFD